MLSKINEESEKKKADYEKLTRSSSQPDPEMFAGQKASLLQQIQEYEKLLSQYKLMVDAKPQALIIIERATPAVAPDQPKPFQTIVAAAILSLLFGSLTALVLDRRKSVKA